MIGCAIRFCGGADLFWRATALLRHPLLLLAHEAGSVPVHVVQREMGSSFVVDIVVLASFSERAADYSWLKMPKNAG